MKKKQKKKKKKKKRRKNNLFALFIFIVPPRSMFRDKIFPCIPFVLRTPSVTRRSERLGSKCYFKAILQLWRLNISPERERERERERVREGGSARAGRQNTI
jgi:hypothetical protein